MSFRAKARNPFDSKSSHLIALKYLEQSLNISREIGHLRKAEQYINRTVQLMEELDHPKLEEWCKALEELSTKLKGWQGHG